MDLAKCDCGKKAIWVYMPGFSDENANDFVCDDCVNRGCSCNHMNIIRDDQLPEDEHIEGVDWKWVNKEKTAWTHLDEKFREYPCCEYEYDEEGFDLDDDEDEEDLDK
jgi:hypothetical protein|tara:strand:+ start:944 stop:1267 length:324 start_codon:yes stop_codon:yes gene_type:complete